MEITLSQAGISRIGATSDVAPDKAAYVASDLDPTMSLVACREDPLANNSLELERESEPWLPVLCRRSPNLLVGSATSTLQPVLGSADRPM